MPSRSCRTSTRAFAYPRPRGDLQDAALGAHGIVVQHGRLGVETADPGQIQPPGDRPPRWGCPRGGVPPPADLARSPRRSMRPLARGSGRRSDRRPGPPGPGPPGWEPGAPGVLPPGSRRRRSAGRGCGSPCRGPPGCRSGCPASAGGGGSSPCPPPGRRWPPRGARPSLLHRPHQRAGGPRSSSQAWGLPSQRTSRPAWTSRGRRARGRGGAPIAMDDAAAAGAAEPGEEPPGVSLAAAEALGRLGAHDATLQDETQRVVPVEFTLSRGDQDGACGHGPSRGKRESLLLLRPTLTESLLSHWERAGLQPGQSSW